MSMGRDDIDAVPELFDAERGSTMIEAEHWIRTLFFDHPTDPPARILLAGWRYDLNREASHPLIPQPREEVA